jgi:hypothetical protein
MGGNAVESERDDGFPFRGCAGLLGLRLAQHRRSQSKNGKAIFANDSSLGAHHAPVAPASDMDTGRD